MSSQKIKRPLNGFPGNRRDGGRTGEISLSPIETCIKVKLGGIIKIMDAEENKEIYFVKKSEKGFPKELLETPWPPKGIYIKGSLQSDAPKVAIVGTRRATSYGKETAFKIAETLAREGIIVVSGLAAGIDSSVHEGALSGEGITWAVLGSGLDNIWPKTNLTLANSIIQKGGALISEYPPETKAEYYTFPQRNRIIAGLSQLIIVIEAPEKSGALITARLALEAGREVAVVPADISRSNFIGSNRLLREGAHPILSPEDALYLIGKVPKEKNAKLDKLDEFAQSLLQRLEEPKSADEIIFETKLEPSLLNQKLMELELKNLVQQKGGLWHKVV